MKIIYVSNAIIPSRAANSVHIMKMCQALAKNGHEVILLAPDKATEKDRHDIFSYYNVEKNFQIKKLPWKKTTGRAYFYGLEVSKFVKRENPDYVYGRFLHGCFFSTIFNNTPVSFEAHTPISKFYERLVFTMMCKRKNFHKLIVISHSLKNHYIENYPLKNKPIIVAHDGADIPKEVVSEASLRLTDSTTINVGYIGHLYKGKGMELIAELVAACSWVNFHIVGGLDADIEYWKKQLDSYDNVQFYGYVPHKETLKYAKACDVLIAPYLRTVMGHRSNKDNLSDWMSPLKIFEYMSMKKPIVCSDLPVLREILTHEENSLLCFPENIEDWIHNFKRLKNDKELRQRISDNAYVDFVNNYTWKARANKILDS